MTCFQDSERITKKFVNMENFTDDFDSDSDCENEPDSDFYVSEDDFDDGEYQPFISEEISFRKVEKKNVKPANLSPEKVIESPPKISTWWDDTKKIDDENRLKDGVLNYSALLPPPRPKPVVEKPKQKKQKKIPKSEQKKSPKQIEKPKIVEGATQPTRLCVSFMKKTKCFHGEKCRYAHSLSDLKECFFNKRCLKVKYVKTNPDGTFEIENRNGEKCNFKHSNETLTSFLGRIPHNTFVKK